MVTKDRLDTARIPATKIGHLEVSLGGAFPDHTLNRFIDLPVMHVIALDDGVVERPGTPEKSARLEPMLRFVRQNGNLFERFQSLGNLRSSTRCLSIERDPGDFSILDEKGLAHGNAHDRNHRHVEGLCDLSIRVGDQCKGKMLVIPERFLRLGLVATDPENLDTLARKSGVGITQRAGLLGTSRRRGLRVEIDEGDSFGIDITEDDGLPILIKGTDEWSRRTHRQGFSAGKEGE